MKKNTKSSNESHSDMLKYIIVAIMVTAFTFIFADASKYLIVKENAFSKSFKSPDYILLDCFSTVEATNPIGILNPDVVIVSDDSCDDRRKLAILIRAIDEMGPAAIGIDHSFENARPEDSLLIEALNDCKSPVVLASELKYDTGFQKYTTISKCVLCDNLNKATSGVVNLDEPSVNPQNIIRRVRRSYFSEDGEENNTFSFELACRSGMLKYNVDSIPQSTFICFRNIYTDIHNWKDIVADDGKPIENDDILESIRGKIVLLGSIDDRSDLHMIPSEECISGVEIHSASIYTFINHEFLNESPRWLNNFIAIICVFLFSIMLAYSSKRMGNIGNLCVRLVQALMIVLFVVIGYYLFRKESNPVYMDFSTAILMVGFSSFIFDVIKGIYGIISSIGKRNK
ncbi:MAG: CHASE2 domain-containing protein [Bacteroidaceae bacterium]|nr:CHASE2 domain-containing protein [Bacteroidaceae bacterium]